MAEETNDRVACPTGRCGTQSVRFIGGGRYCGKCLASLGAGMRDGEMPHHEASFGRHMREVEEFTANRALLADPPLPVKLRPLLDIVSEIHQLTHELAERLAKA